MVRCQRCGGYGAGLFPFLRKHARLWDDLLEQALLDRSPGLSLRQQIERQAAERLWPVGRQALNRRINEVTSALFLLRDAPIENAPPIVQCDGPYFPAMERTRQVKRDARRRLRCRLRLRQRVALVAPGLWPDGRHQVLGRALADRESEEAWRDFLLSLHARGLTPTEALHFARTSGHVGRLVRELCRRVRHLGPLVTDVGAEAALGFLLARLNGRWCDQPWLSPLMKATREVA